MNRKKALAVLMAAAMTSSIFGAVPAMASEDKPFEGQEITFADTGGGSWDEKLEPIIAKFEEETGAKSQHGALRPLRLSGNAPGKTSL